MKRKYIFMLILLVISLYFIGATSAVSNDSSDNNISDEYSDQHNLIKNIEVNENVEQSIPSTPKNIDKLQYNQNDNDKIAISVSGNSFSDIRTALKDANDGDIISLTNNIYKCDSESITINHNNIIIKGLSTSKTILDVNNKDSKALIVNGKNIRLENLIFKNMDCEKYGIVFIDNTNCSIVNCEFIDNTGHVGGILINDGADYTTIRNCIFTNNNAKYADGSGGMAGGAIDSHASHTTITDCLFTNNNANDKGGAIYLTRGQNNLVNNCIFTNNHGKNGGAIFIQSVSANIINSNFTNNTADKGGAIYNLATLNLYNCPFQMNRANSTINVNSKSYVNCSDDAIIKITLEGGNNILDAIWSENPINIDNKTNNPNNKLSSKQVSLTFGDKIFNQITNNNGEATFKFNTINFKVKNYQCQVSFKQNNDYFKSTKNFNIKITKKIVYKIKLKNKKKIKNKKSKTKKIYEAYIPSVKYITVDSKTDYYRPNKNNESQLYWLCQKSH